MEMPADQLAENILHLCMDNDIDDVHAVLTQLLCAMSLTAGCPKQTMMSIISDTYDAMAEPTGQKKDVTYVS